MKSLKQALFLVLIPLTFVSAQSVETEPFEPVRYEYDQGEVTKILDQAISEAEADIKKIANIPAAERNFRNTIEAFEFVLAQLRWQLWPIIQAPKIVQDPVVLKEVALCVPRIRQYLADKGLRKDMAKAFGEFHSNMRGDYSSLNPFERTLAEQMARISRQSGALLEGQVYEDVRTLTLELEKIKDEFAKNLVHTTSLFFSEKELEGVPLKDLEGLKEVSQGNAVAYEVPINATNFLNLIRYAAVAQTREKMENAWHTQGGTRNTELHIQAIKIREQIAQAIGYPTWVDLRADGRMAENAEGVKALLDGVTPNIVQRNREVLAELLK